MPQKSNLSAIGSRLKSASQKKQEIANVQPQAPVEQAQPAQYNTLGRRKKLLTDRSNAVTVYCTGEMVEQFDRIDYNNRIGKQRVIQAAIDHFMSKFYDPKHECLTQEGFNIVREFEKKITIE